jgi:ATP-dependent RNA helicase TDRD9
MYSSISSLCQDDEDDGSKFSGQIALKGPFSPLEVKFNSIINCGFSKHVRVERDSINYATLDDDPTNNNTRLIVAADVTLNAERNTLVLRKTTVFPKIPGLSALCCLLYSPRIELRSDSKFTRYTGALCGLGYDEKNRIPVHTDNDIECTFDVKIDHDDITMVC